MDHPAPGVGVMAILISSVCGLIVAILAMLHMPTAEVPRLAWPIAALTLVVVCFYFWPLYSTYYTVSAAGIEVRYGPWIRSYPWSDFAAAYWQRGLFATRIGWPSVTPCVRLSDGVLLKRRAKRLGLYVTPNDPRAFLLKIAEFAPDLTAEAII